MLNIFSPITYFFVFVIMPYGEQLGFPDADTMNWAMELHYSGCFLDFEQFENPWPSADEEAYFGNPDRALYHFGSTCPLELAEGADQCKAFKQKCYSCRSYVREEFARNYLAKHAFESGNHPETRGDTKKAFEQAQEAIIVKVVETAADRHKG